MVMKFETIQLKIFSNAEDGELKKILESGEVIFQNGIIENKKLGRVLLRNA